MTPDEFGIWPPYEIFYIHAMLYNTSSAQISFEKVMAVIETLREDISKRPEVNPFDEIDRDALLNDIQNIIIQGAAISRYFWPTRPGYEKRAEQLKTCFGITEDNPLKNRDFRNFIEHFDERLDDYLKNGVAGYFVPQFVGTSHGNEQGLYKAIRAFYADIGVFEILGNRFKLQPIVDELIRIHNLLLQFDENGSRMQQQKEKSS